MVCYEITAVNELVVSAFTSSIVNLWFLSEMRINRSINVNSPVSLLRFPVSNCNIEMFKMIK